MLKRFVLKPLLYLSLLVLLLLICGLAYRSYTQIQVERSTAITTAGGIESLETVEVRGDTQWIYVRGHDRSNPVLLYLHGGPGMTELPIARSFGLELEKHFTVVHWDQRGSGKSRTRDLSASELTIDSYVQDVLALTNYLRERFGQDKIFLVGHSWGSLLGVLSVRDHPQLYHAYVGVGQIANIADNERLSLDYVRDVARTRGNSTAQRELAAVDPLQYGEDIAQLQVQRKWLYLFGGGFRGIGILELVWLYVASPEYSLLDLRRLLTGSNALPTAMWSEVMAVDLVRDANEFALPVYFLGVDTTTTRRRSWPGTIWGL
ncbi:MAG: alpha/beta fold hydrolase [Halioglobus sp.]|nr:alpha/beta fold hydrolase [Halioglobus sp.]